MQGKESYESELQFLQGNGGGSNVFWKILGRNPESYLDFCPLHLRLHLLTLNERWAPQAHIHSPINAASMFLVYSLSFFRPKKKKKWGTFGVSCLQLQESWGLGGEDGYLYVYI